MNNHFAWGDPLVCSNFKLARSIISAPLGEFIQRALLQGRPSEGNSKQKPPSDLLYAQREINAHISAWGDLIEFATARFSSLMSLISALGRNSQFTQRKARLYLGLLSSGQPGALWEVWRSGGEEVAPGNGGRELGFCCVQTGFVPRASSTLSRFLHFQTSSCWAKLRNRWWEPHQQRTKRRRVELRANWANSHTVSTGGMSPKVAPNWSPKETVSN